MTVLMKNSSAGDKVDMTCPVCVLGESSFFAKIDGYDYMQCGTCGSLHIDRPILDEIDAGKSPRLYDEAYWREELRSAADRSGGESLVRSGEAIFYSRRPVRRFLDIGTGPGYLLDQLAKQFPRHADMFHGVELFPPDERSQHPNYHVGEIGDLQDLFDAGVCIEVVEHLTPRMLNGLARGLAKVSAPGALWLFNTGMPDLVLNQDPGYLDPLHRGHIVSYGLKGLAHIFEPQGFRISAVPGKNYAFVAEFQPTDDAPDFEYRIYHPLPENKALLDESGLMYQAAAESARASFFYEQYLARTRWALELQRERESMLKQWFRKLPPSAQAAARRLRNSWQALQTDRKRPAPNGKH